MVGFLRGNWLRNRSELVAESTSNAVARAVSNKF
jgi:hypothetical protein